MVVANVGGKRLLDPGYSTRKWVGGGRGGIQYL
jgi:hypothetical protein